MNGRINHKKWKQALNRLADHMTFDSKKERRVYVNGVAHARRLFVLERKRAKKIRKGNEKE